MFFVTGFSTNSTPWLPVHENYKTLNVENEKKQANSHYKVYTSLVALRKTSNPLKEGDVQTAVLNNDVLAVKRSAKGEIVLLLLNFKNESVTVNLDSLVNQRAMLVKMGSVGSSVSQK